MRLRWMAAAAGFLVAGGGIVVFGGPGPIGALLSTRPATAAGPCATSAATGPDTGPVAALTDEQSRNATAIVRAGQELGVPQRGWVIAVATAMQESRLVNVGHGDTAGPDSRGLFQQRDSWGPVEVRMDPAGAARLFYRALTAVDGWEVMPLDRAAQAVQRSAFPRLYLQWESLAEQTVAGLAHVTVAARSCTARVVAGWALPLPADKVVTPTTEHHNYPAVDLPVAEGTAVFAIVGGVASPMEEDGGCGHGVFVRADDDEWLYCHLARRSVSAGQRVGPGDQVGLSGNSGDSTGPHLHVQLRRGGVTVCLNRVVDELVAGRPAPGELSAVYPCLPHGG